MGAGSRRSAPLPPGWEKTRRRILRRDGGVCQWPVPAGVCGATANQVDHKNPVHLGGPEVGDEGLWSLCTPHHNRKTGQEAGRAWGVERRKMIAARYRQPEAHPGLLPPARRNA